MLTEPLPSSLDVRKAAARGVSISGALQPLDLQRFRDLLAADAGSVQATLAFSRDEENRYLIAVSVQADVVVSCQRCLEPLQLQLESDNLLAVVWDDEYARQLPRDLEPLIVGEEPCNLWELVEEELILGMPPYSYHEAEDCNKILSGFSEPPPDESGEDGKPNPFDVLAQMKPGNKH
jgi:uncharacterized protein